VIPGPKGEPITAGKAKALLAALDARLSASSHHPLTTTRPGARRASASAALLANENKLATEAAPSAADVPSSPSHGPAQGPSHLIGHAAIETVCPSDGAIKVLSVNGRAKGTAYVPGGRYVITGCSFGKTSAWLSVGGQSTTGKVQSFNLQVESWASGKIIAHVDPALQGIGDIAVATLTVANSAGQGVLGGAEFVATRDTVQLPLTKDLVDLNVNGHWPPRTDGATVSRTYLAVPEAARTYDTYGVGPDDAPGVPGNKFCDPWVSAVDRWRMDKITATLAAQAFEIVSATVDDLTPTLVVDDSDSQTVNLGAFSFEWNGDELDVTPRGYSLYVKESFWVSDAGYSKCTSRYQAAVFATGPKGVPPRLTP
jgi:hypothetical protein